jgi:GntR family transcriptional repressor for pyruvate dehydrogenase complex
LLSQHQAIFDAIVARNASAARDAAGVHLDYVRELYGERPAIRTPFHSTRPETTS